MQLVFYYVEKKSTRRHISTGDQGLGFRPLTDSKSHDQSCGGGNDRDLEPKEHRWSSEEGTEVYQGRQGNHQ